MLDRFLQNIKKHALFEPNDQLLVAVSGGVDSVVMVDLLHKGGYQLTLAHCNFQLRGEESNKDEALVKQLAARYNLPIHLNSFETADIASKRKISIQMAARELRYTWFDSLIDEFGFKFLLTAHHQNDSAETMLINLTRGTSIHGLKGIEFKSERLRRPLAFFNKDEVTSYAIANQITWREDASNQEEKYLRNAIRHQILPKLESLNPSFLKQMDQLAEKNQAVERVWNTHIKNFRRSYLHPINETDFNIIKEPFAKDHSGPFELFELIQPYGFNYDQAQSAIEQKMNIGNSYHAGEYIMFVNREYFTLQKSNDEENGSIFITEEQSEVDGKDWMLKISLVPRPANISKEKEEYFNCQSMTFPLELRKWKKGDKMKPLGMKGSKLVSDILIDKKVDISKKQSVHVLLSGDKICWLIGYQISEDFKVLASDQEVLKIAYS